ncbi:hypothetical protein [Silvanigrella sp.]|jgi:hypothetical protein|uniref:hypothetical protein n=1 Tax=Silvanigrella sp. TaxID=2024976 RepID=UPI0037C5E071
MINKEKLEAFFFILNRDYLPFGKVEEIFKNHVDKISEENKPVFEDKNLEAYCKNLVKKFEN